ncbi:MAG TPA: hypothetical protein VMW41_01175 [Candidatus Bathyarchaeia archaeon]|nr:hypothetical protein [Candidatus Bathyarchaeia archaeon]
MSFFDFLVSGSVFLSLLALIFYGSVWLLKESTKKLLEKELEKHKNNLSKELEVYKKEIDLSYRHQLSLQDRSRKLFEEFSNSLEEIYKTKGDELSLRLNKLFGLLALYAPDKVYRVLRKSLDGKALPNEVKPPIYFALRKSLFGAKSKLKEGDLIKHIKAKRLMLKDRYLLSRHWLTSDIPIRFFHTRCGFLNTDV